MYNTEVVYHKTSLKLSKVLIIILIVGGLLRAANLNWDGAYFFHPDERNIADSVGRINFSKGELDPEFYAYGSFPIYLTRFLLGDDVSGKNNFLMLRLESVFLSTASIWLVYYIVKKILLLFKRNSELPALAGAFLTAFSPGLIQFAHFGTFETFLTAEYLLITALLLYWYFNRSRNIILVISLVIGLVISTKIINLFLLPIPFILSIVQEKRINFTGIRNGILAIIFSSLIFIATSPYYIFSFSDFWGSLQYESSVASGSILVFYTQQFIGTTPVLYQVLHIFPYILGLSVFAISILMIIPSAALMIFNIKKVFRKYFFVLILIAIVPLFYLIFNLVLYVKWTRYMLPAVPYVIIFICSIGAVIFYKFKRIQKPVIILSCFVFCFSMVEGIIFTGRYISPDPRIELSKWAYSNISESELICTEPLDVGIIPLDTKFDGHIEILEMYDSETKYNDFDALNSDAQKCDYIILLSNRIYPLRFRLPDQYPLGHKFFTKLNDGSLGFDYVLTIDKTFGTHVDKPHLSANNFLYPDETFNVFDNPTIIVYKKQ